jgi:hypothetical protein
MLTRISTASPRTRFPLSLQQIEETLKRISQQKGVEGYIIADDLGNVLRTTFTDEPDRDMVAKLSQDLPALASRASSAVRDLDPTVRARARRARSQRRAQLAMREGRRAAISQLPPAPPLPPPARVAQNVMRFVRVQTKKKELMISKGARRPARDPPRAHHASVRPRSTFELGWAGLSAGRDRSGTAGCGFAGRMGSARREGALEPADQPSVTLTRRPPVCTPPRARGASAMRRHGVCHDGRAGHCAI